MSETGHTVSYYELDYDEKARVVSRVRAKLLRKVSGPKRGA